MSTFNCIICRGNHAQPHLLEARDYYLNTPFVVNYWRCLQCSVVQQSPVPKEIDAFYEDYPIHQKKSVLHSLMRRWIIGPTYFQTHKIPHGSTLLDYGCGDGWFLRENQGKGIHLVGFELNSNQAKRLHAELGIPVLSDVAELATEYSGKIDVLTQHFVLEHVTDIHQSFEIARGLLKEGGIFYVLVPEIDSWEGRLFGRFWHNLDAPRHISFPSPSAIHSLAQQHGFSLFRDDPVPFPNGIAGSLPVIFSGRFRFPLFLLSLPLGILMSRIAPGGARAYQLKKLPPDQP